MLSSTVDFAGSRITRRQISGDSCEGFSRLDWYVGIPLSTLTKMGRPTLNLGKAFFMTPQGRSLACLSWHLTHSQVHLFCLYHCCRRLCHSSLTSELNFFGPQCGLKTSVALQESFRLLVPDRDFWGIQPHRPSPYWCSATPVWREPHDPAVSCLSI